MVGSASYLFFFPQNIWRQEMDGCNPCTEPTWRQLNTSNRQQQGLDLRHLFDWTDLIGAIYLTLSANATDHYSKKGAQQPPLGLAIRLYVQYMTEEDLLAHLTRSCLARLVNNRDQPPLTPVLVARHEKQESPSRIHCLAPPKRLHAAIYPQRGCPRTVAVNGLIKENLHGGLWIRR